MPSRKIALNRLEEEAQEFVSLLAKHFGRRAQQRREAFVRVLEIYDAQLPEFLISQWKDDHEDDAE